MADYDPLITLKGDLRRWLDQHAGDDQAEIVWSVHEIERMADFLQWAFDRFVDVSGAGHMVAGDRNDAFATALVDFLCGLEAA